MEKSNNYDEILKAGKGKIKDTKTINAFTTNYLPEGEFTVEGWTIESMKNDEGNLNHYYQLHTNNGGKVSVNSLQALAFISENEPTVEDLRKVDRKESVLHGKYVFAGSNVRPINPHLSGDQAKIISEMMGNTYENKIVVGKIIPFGKNTTKPDTTLKSVDTKNFFQIKSV
jgi:hypothetical protein